MSTFHEALYCVLLGHRRLPQSQCQLVGPLSLVHYLPDNVPLNLLCERRRTDGAQALPLGGVIEGSEGRQCSSTSEHERYCMLSKLLM